MDLPKVHEPSRKRAHYGRQAVHVVIKNECMFRFKMFERVLTEFKSSYTQNTRCRHNMILPALIPLLFVCIQPEDDAVESYTCIPSFQAWLEQFYGSKYQEMVCAKPLFEIVTDIFDP